MKKNPSSSMSETSPMSGSVAQTMRSAPRQRFSLLVFQPDQVTAVPLSPNKPVVVGRQECDVIIADGLLSRQHARFLLEHGAVTVEDLGSRNGTRVNGELVTRPVVVPNGAEILLGGVPASVHEVVGRELPDFGLETDEAFARRVEQEITRARRFGRAPVVLLVRPDHAGRPLPLWYPRVRETLRDVDSAGIYRPDIVEILLPETSAEEAAARAADLSATSADGSRLLCGVAAASPGVSASDLISSAHAALEEASRASPVQIAESRGVWFAGDRRPDETLRPHEFVTRNAGVEYLLVTARRIAQKSVSLLIQGETGVGKEVLARLVHDASPRRGGPFVTINCAAVPATLVESTFFGHEKGAFTGANGMRKGPFEIAGGGTVFLDEIGELSPEAQAALLRVLETKRVTRVGATREVEVDVRVLAATNRDLDAMSEAGKFRSDLLYRINQVVLDIRPLRERSEDIEPLAAHFLSLANDANERDAAKRGGRVTRVQSIDPAAIGYLQSYRWPGNARELRNVVERAVAICEGDRIMVQNLPDRVLAMSQKLQVTVPDPPVVAAADLSPSTLQVKPPFVPLEGGLEETLARVEADLIVQALDRTDGVQINAAKILGVSVRTLQNKIKQYGIRARWEAKP